MMEGTARAAAILQERYPGWTVRTVLVWDRLRIEASRDGASGGLYAVIGTESEVQAELENAAPSGLRAAS